MAYNLRPRKVIPTVVINSDNEDDNIELEVEAIIHIDDDHEEEEINSDIDDDDDEEEEEEEEEGEEEEGEEAAQQLHLEIT